MSFTNVPNTIRNKNVSPIEERKILIADLKAKAAAAGPEEAEFLKTLIKKVEANTTYNIHIHEQFLPEIARKTLNGEWEFIAKPGLSKEGILRVLNQSWEFDKVMSVTGYRNNAMAFLKDYRRVATDPVEQKHLDKVISIINADYSGKTWLGEIAKGVAKKEGTVWVLDNAAPK